MIKIALIGTYDTKGIEYQYLDEKLQEHGVSTVRIDMSVMGESRIPVDYRADAVALEGGACREELQRKQDREYAQGIMAAGASRIIMQLYHDGAIHGIVSMGGGQGISMLSRVYQELPIGFPKFMLSPLASTPGKMEMFRGINDTMTMNTIVDIAGLNSILRHAIEAAAASIAAAAKEYVNRSDRSEKSVVGISMFGITTKCVCEIERILMEHGYEVLVFHTNGTGGRSMEKMVRDGYIKAVIDVTTSEVIQNLCGGSCDAGEHRMESMIEMQVPYIVVPGAMDVVNFMVNNPIPEKYKNRNFHMHGLVAKVMRTSAEENETAAKAIAEKLNKSMTPEKIQVILPLKGISANDVPGNECYMPDVDAVLFENLRKTIKPEIQITELDYHINDMEFARSVAEKFMEMYPVNK